MFKKFLFILAFCGIVCNGYSQPSVMVNVPLANIIASNKVIELGGDVILTNAGPSFLSTNGVGKVTFWNNTNIVGGGGGVATNAIAIEGGIGTNTTLVNPGFVGASEFPSTNADLASRGITNTIHIALRSDGLAGLGTAENPLNGSGFNTLSNLLWNPIDNTTYYLHGSGTNEYRVMGSWYGGMLQTGITNSPIMFLGKTNISLIGIGNPIINSTNGYQVVTIGNSDNIAIRGIVFRGGSRITPTNTSQFGVIQSRLVTHNISFTDNIVSNFPLHGFLQAPVASSAHYNYTIARNSFAWMGATNYGSLIYDGTCLPLTSMVNAEVYGNRYDQVLRCLEPYNGSTTTIPNQNVIIHDEIGTNIWQHGFVAVSDSTSSNLAQNVILRDSVFIKHPDFSIPAVNGNAPFVWAGPANGVRITGNVFESSKNLTNYFVAQIDSIQGTQVGMEFDHNILKGRVERMLQVYGSAGAYDGSRYLQSGPKVNNNTFIGDWTALAVLGGLNGQFSGNTSIRTGSTLQGFGVGVTAGNGWRASGNTYVGGDYHVYQVEGLVTNFTASDDIVIPGTSRYVQSDAGSSNVSFVNIRGSDGRAIDIAYAIGDAKASGVEARGLYTIGGYVFHEPGNGLVINNYGTNGTNIVIVAPKVKMQQAGSDFASFGVDGIYSVPNHYFGGNAYLYGAGKAVQWQDTNDVYGAFASFQADGFRLSNFSANNPNSFFDSAGTIQLRVNGQSNLVVQQSKVAITTNAEIYNIKITSPLTNGTIVAYQGRDSDGYLVDAPLPSAGTVNQTNIILGTNVLKISLSTGSYLTNVGTTDVSAIITNLPAGSAVDMGPGIYETRGLFIARTNLTINGAGVGLTTLKSSTNAYIGGDGKSTVVTFLSTNDNASINNLTVDANGYGVISHTNACNGVVSFGKRIVAKDVDVVGVRGRQLYTTAGSEGFGFITASYLTPRAGGSVLERVRVYNFATNDQTRTIYLDTVQWIFATGIYLEQHGIVGTETDQYNSVVKDCFVDFTIPGNSNRCGVAGISANANTTVQGSTIRGAIAGGFRDSYNISNLKFLNNSFAHCYWGISLAGLSNEVQTTTNVMIWNNTFVTRSGGFAVGLTLYDYNTNDYITGVDIGYNNITDGSALTNTAAFIIFDQTGNNQISNVKIHDNTINGGFARLPSYTSGTTAGILYKDNKDQFGNPYALDQKLITLYNADNIASGYLGFNANNTLMELSAYGPSATTGISGVVQVQLNVAGSTKFSVDSTGVLLSNTAVRGWIPIEFNGTNYGRVGFTGTGLSPNNFVWENFGAGTNDYIAPSHAFVTSGTETLRINQGNVQQDGYYQFKQGGSARANVGMTGPGAFEVNVFDSSVTNYFRAPRIRYEIGGFLQEEVFLGEHRFTNTLVRLDSDAFLVVTNVGSGVRDHLRFVVSGGHSANVGFLSSDTNVFTVGTFDNTKTNRLEGAPSEIWVGGARVLQTSQSLVTLPTNTTIAQLVISNPSTNSTPRSYLGLDSSKNVVEVPVPITNATNLTASLRSWLAIPASINLYSAGGSPNRILIQTNASATITSWVPVSGSPSDAYLWVSNSSASPITITMTGTARLMGSATNALAIPAGKIGAISVESFDGAITNIIGTIVQQ